MPYIGRDEASPRRRDGAIANLSLEYKLPILIGALLLAVIIALSVAAYIQVRRMTMATASDRIQAVSGQLRDIFQQSGSQLRALAAATAANPPIVEYARSRAPASKALALDALRYRGPQPDQVIASEIRDSADVVVLTTDSTAGVDTLHARSAAGRPPAGDSVVVGRFSVLRDTMVYPVTAVIRDASNARVVIWRKLVGSRRTREQIGALVGSDAAVFLGNPGSSPWTDLERPVAHPDSGARITPIPGTQWAVAVDFPRSTILAPVDRLLSRFSVIAVTALLLGLIAAWIATRRITQPLRRLTAAAGAIASGDYAVPPSIDRSDELGRLADAFATMASEVRDTRAGLETKVEDRTRDLNTALEQLHETQETLVRREKLAILGQLAGGVGHELRNPLGVMTNAVYYLKMVLAAQPATVHEYLEILQQQITLSEKIVSDLLDFARSKPPQRARASLGELTNAQIVRLGATNGVRIDSQILSDSANIFVDKVQVGQIILNLLTNAVQAIDGPGTITVRVRDDATTASLEVTDTGAGVPIANIEKIFEPLFTTKARGIGLGLAVSRTLARANDGELSVVSPVGEGATFRLTLPVVDGAAS